MNISKNTEQSGENHWSKHPLKHWFLWFSKNFKALSHKCDPKYWSILLLTDLSTEILLITAIHWDSLKCYKVFKIKEILRKRKANEKANEYKQ